MKNWKIMIVILVLLLFIVVGCGGQTTPPDDDTPIDALALIESHCTQCHTLDNVYVDRDTDRWPGIVRDMTRRSSRRFSDAEVTAITEYLQENYGN